MSADGFELRWVGVEGDCAGDSLNGKPIHAGTSVRIEATHLKPLRGERPDTVWIFPKPDGLMGVLLKNLGYRPPCIDSLPLEQSAIHGRRGYVSTTQAWRLPPPLETLGRLSLYCSTARDGSSLGPEIVSKPTGLEETERHGSSRSFEAGVDIAGFEGNVVVNGGATTVVKGHAMTALDPDVEIDAITPHNYNNFDKLIWDYVTIWSRVLELSENAVHKAFSDEYARYLSSPPGSHVSVSVKPDRVHLEPGDGVELQLSITANAPTMVLVRARDLVTNHEEFSSPIAVEAINSLTTWIKMGEL
jgi:hypothetical protein